MGVYKVQQGLYRARGLGFRVGIRVYRNFGPVMENPMEKAMKKQVDFYRVVWFRHHAEHIGLSGAYLGFAIQD